MAAPLDADDAARVLRRAHDIEAAHQSPTDVAIDHGGMSPEALIAAADEVGIDPDAVRDALAIERLDGALPAPRRLDRVVGPAAVVVEHVVGHTPSEASERVEAWLTTAHRMRCVTDADGRIEARPRSGMTASLGRRLTALTGEVNIRSVTRMSVDVEALHLQATEDRPRTLVQVTADRRESRLRRLGGGSAAGLAGAGTAAAAVAGSLPLLSIASVGFFTGGWLVVRSGGSSADKIELELMRVLTAVDRGDTPTGLVGRATRRVGAVVRDAARQRRD